PPLAVPLPPLPSPSMGSSPSEQFTSKMDRKTGANFRSFLGAGASFMFRRAIGCHRSCRGDGEVGTALSRRGKSALNDPYASTKAVSSVHMQQSVKSAALTQPSPFVAVKNGRFFVEGAPHSFVGANLWCSAYLGVDAPFGNRERLRCEL